MLLERLRNRLNRWFEQLICVEGFVQDFVVRSGSLEQVIVLVAAFGWVDAHKVASALVLRKRFPDVLPISAIGRPLHRLDHACPL